MSQRGGQKRLRAENGGVTQPQAEAEQTSGGKQNSLQQLENALASIKNEWEVERNSLQEKVSQLEKELCEERVTTARCQQEIGDLRQELDDSKAQPGAAKESGQRREEEEKRLHFVLAGNGQVGSIPRSHLESAPDSLLCKMYNGEWEYARDKQGRALINCHPDRWAAVLEHLATGAVPAERNPQLLEQARHWNLERLVNALEAMTPGVVVTTLPDTKEFTVRCTFVSVRRAVQGDKHSKLYFADPEAKDIWEVQVQKEGVYLRSPSLEDEIEITCKMRVLLRDKVVNLYEGESDVLPYKAGGDIWGYEFGDTLKCSLDQLLSQPLARAEDCLV